MIVITRFVNVAKHTKYENVNATVFIFNGNFENRSLFPIDAELQIDTLSSGIVCSEANNCENKKVRNVLHNKNNKNNNPLISDENNDDNTKKHTKIKGVKRNPIYNNGTRFMTYLCVYSYYIYFHLHIPPVYNIYSKLNTIYGFVSILCISGVS